MMLIMSYASIKCNDDIPPSDENNPALSTK